MYLSTVSRNDDIDNFTTNKKDNNIADHVCEFDDASHYSLFDSTSNFSSFFYFENDEDGNDIRFDIEIGTIVDDRYCWTIDRAIAYQRINYV